METPHFLLVVFPARGHINPAFQFAERLIRIGNQVTLVTSLFAQQKMIQTSSIPSGLSIVTFSDGYDHGFSWEDNDPDLFIQEVRRCGSKALTDLIKSHANEGKPITCLVYTFLMQWVAEVARLQHLPSAVLWPQAVTSLDIYYYYFNDHNDVFSKCIDPSYVVELPCLPPLTMLDLPSLLLPSNTQILILSGVEEHIKILSEETKPIVLVNTFDSLEVQALKAIEKFNIFGIGPLIPLYGVPNDNVQPSANNYINYLNSKPKESVVYISFGSYFILTRQQMEEFAKGLKNSGRPFLWVIREDQGKKINAEKEESEFSFREDLEQHGMVVPWCSQVEVLSHKSLGCFVTHCGWNSTIESLVCGAPLVVFPQWIDQGTNAKLIEDVWGTGVRVVRNEDGIVTSGEIERCLDLVMGSGDKAMEIRSNAKKWKELAIEATMEGGSSHKNLESFVVEVVGK